MEQKIKKQIKNVEMITRYIVLFFITIFLFLYNITTNYIFIAITLTLFICEILNIIILTHIHLKVSDIFFEELLKKIDNRKVKGEKE